MNNFSKHFLKPSVRITCFLLVYNKVTEMKSKPLKPNTNLKIKINNTKFIIINIISNSTVMHFLKDKVNKICMLHLFPKPKLH